MVIVRRTCSGCRYIIPRDGIVQCRTELRCVCRGRAVVGLTLRRDCAKGQLTRRDRARSLRRRRGKTVIPRIRT